MTRIHSETYGVVVPLAEIEDLSQVAYDLHYFLGTPNNSDMDRYFPEIVHEFTGKLGDIEERLAQSKAKYEIGSHEVFVTFIGTHAVGMSIITDQVKAPEILNQNWPHLGEFICNPYRGLGLGKLAVDHYLDVIRSSFGGHAWTSIHRDNIHAKELIIEAGFHPVPASASGQPDHDLYALG